MMTNTAQGFLKNKYLTCRTLYNYKKISAKNFAFACAFSLFQLFNKKKPSMNIGLYSLSKIKAYIMTDRPHNNINVVFIPYTQIHKVSFLFAIINLLKSPQWSNTEGIIYLQPISILNTHYSILQS